MKHHFHLRNMLLLVATATSGHALAESPDTAGPATGTARTQVTAALNLAARAKLAVSETYFATGQWPETNAAASFAPNPTAGFVPTEDTPTTITVGSGGRVTVTFNTPGEIAGESLILTPTAEDGGIIKWSCASAGVSAEYLPETCR